MNVKFAAFLSLLVSAALGQAIYGQANPFVSKDGTSLTGDPFETDKKIIPPKEFSVSKANANAANKALFLTLWDALQNPRFREGAERRQFIISQAVGKEAGLHRYLAGSESVILKNGNHLEDEWVTAWVNRDGVYDFTTVAGSTRRVAQFVEAIATPDPDAPTQEEFIKKLKDGESFTVRVLHEKGCIVCNGDGKMSTLQGGGNCESCQGSGESLQTYILKW